MSATVFAENNEKTDIKEEGYEIVLDFEKSGDVYTGEEISPEIDVVKKDDDGNIIETLTSDDYEVVYSDNVDAGTAKISVSGHGNYKGILEKEYTINKASLESAEITLSKESYIYDGTAKKPEVTVIFRNKNLTTDDYIVSYSANINAGEAKVVVSAKENSKNFCGVTEKAYTINRASLNDATVSFEYKYYYYTGEYRKPAPIVKLNGKTIKKANYTVTYSNNKNVGTAVVTVKAQGTNYEGSKKGSFTIRPKATSISLSRAYNKVLIK